MNKETNRDQGIDIKALKKIVFVRFFLALIVLGLVFFLSAGTIRYWQAWAYLIAVFIPMMIFGIYMFKHNPKFLERRMRTRETRKKQKLIQTVGLLPFLLTFVMPGIDIRFRWSGAPVYAAIIGLALILLGYLMTLYVFLTNSFASRVVEVEKEQRVITTGPYAFVRHPMYVAVIIFYGMTPLALGSYWALIFSLMIIPILIVRIKDEEKELEENLAGYGDYMHKVRYRLIPGVW